MPDNFQNIKLFYLNDLDNNRFLLTGTNLKIEKNVIIKNVDKKEEEYTKELCSHNHKNIINLYEIIENDTSDYNFLIFEHNGISLKKIF